MIYFYFLIVIPLVSCLGAYWIDKLFTLHCDNDMIYYLRPIFFYYLGFFVVRFLLLM